MVTGGKVIAEEVGLSLENGTVADLGQANIAPKTDDRTMTQKHRFETLSVHAGYKPDPVPPCGGGCQ